MVLVDIGRLVCALVIHKKQSVLAANFPVGGNYLTQHLSKALRCTFEEAELLKRQHNYLAGDMSTHLSNSWKLKNLMSWLIELAVLQKLFERYISRKSGAGAAFACSYIPFWRGIVNARTG